MRKNVTEGRSKGALEAQDRVHTRPSFLAAWWCPLSPLSVALPPPFYKIFISWKTYTHFFTYFLRRRRKSSSSTREGIFCCSVAATEGKLTLSSPLALHLHGEKIMHPHLQKHHHIHHHHLRINATPLTWTLDCLHWTLCMFVLRDLRLFCGEVIFSDYVVFIMPPIIAMIHRCE
jgi:hypothetical protein